MLSQCRHRCKRELLCGRDVKDDIALEEVRYVRRAKAEALRALQHCADAHPRSGTDVASAAGSSMHLQLSFRRALDESMVTSCCCSRF